VWKRGDRVFFSPEAAVLARRVYWYVWARFYPDSRIWPEPKRGAALGLMPIDEVESRDQILPKGRCRTL
jgi:hypothetical protein